MKNNWFYLGMVCEKLPSPLNMEDARAEKLMTSIAKTFDSLPSVTQALKKYFIACSSSDDGPIIAFVSKMTPVMQSIKKILLVLYLKQLLIPVVNIYH